MPGSVSHTLRRIEAFQDLHRGTLDVPALRASHICDHMGRVSSSPDTSVVSSESDNEPFTFSSSRRSSSTASQSSTFSQHAQQLGEDDIHTGLRNMLLGEYRPNTPSVDSRSFASSSSTSSHVSPPSQQPFDLDEDRFAYWNETQLRHIHQASRDLSRWQFIEWVYATFEVRCAVNGSVRRMSCPQCPGGRNFVSELASLVADMLASGRLWVENDMYGEIAQTVEGVLESWSGDSLM